MIKLLLVIPTLDQSGAEKQFGLLASRLPREEFDVQVAALSRGGPYEEILRAHHIPVSIFHKRSRFDPKTILRLHRLIRSFQPDVVLSGLFAANSSTRLAVSTIRREQRPAMVVSERCVDSWKSGWQLWLDRCLQPVTDRLVANSQSVAEFYQQHGYPAEQIAVIPNGVEAPPTPVISREELLRQCQLPENARIVAYVGRLARQKRIKDLIWAAQLLRQTDERVYFLVIGDGPERGALELHARDVEVTDHVRFLGHRPDAASLLHHIDVFWLASAFEGMSNSLMEAMACGKPVVVSDIPPNRELVVHDQEGYLSNLGDSVGYAQLTHRILQDSALAERLGAAGKAKMQQEFSIDRMVQRFADLIRSELNNRQRR